MRSVIIGCGGIGSRYDEETAPAPIGARTHAAAYSRDSRCTLVGVCDLDPERSRAAGAYWNAAAFDDAHAMLAELRPDIVSICTPSTLRLPLVEAAITNGARAIWCEKPVAIDLATAAQIRERVASSGVVFMVNHLRRWSPLRSWLEAALAGGELGKAETAIAVYGKGLRNNGSHHLDLLSALFGTPRAMTRISDLDDGWRGDGTDATVGARFAAGDVTAYLVPTDHRNFTLFELDLILSEGRLRVTELGQRVEIFGIQAEEQFAGYRRPHKIEELTGGLDGSFERALDDLLGCMATPGRRPACTIDDAIGVMQAVDALLALPLPA